MEAPLSAETPATEARRASTSSEVVEAEEVKEEEGGGEEEEAQIKCLLELVIAIDGGTRAFSGALLLFLKTTSEPAA